MAQPGLASGTASFPAPGGSLGTVSIPLAPEKLNIVWRLYQVTIAVGVATDQATAFNAYLALNGVPVSSRCTALSPMTADGDPYIDIGPHQTLTAEVSGISPAVTNTVLVSYLYDELGAA